VILRTRAPGKINVCLYVGPTDAGTGLHTLVSVMEPLSLADELELAPAFGSAHDVVECEGVDGPNLAADALARFREATGWDGPPVRLRIEKHLPVAAGMGGGSSDAAATLRLAARLAGEAADHVAPQLGSDVPALLRTVPSLVTGTGADVTPLSPLPGHAVVVLPSAPGLTAAEVYREADRLGLPRTAEALEQRRRAVDEALRHGELPEPVNDLEPAARSLRPEIDEALEALTEAGAEHAFVTGSGPTAVGLFTGDDPELRAKGAVARLRDRWPHAAAATPVTESFGEVTVG
jgi:4-diphosphocytidyl-2-C-methyl-D-erythritol kinase